MGERWGLILNWINPHFSHLRECAPGRIRTCDTGFRRAVLYPLSYGGVVGVRLLEGTGRWGGRGTRLAETEGPIHR